MGESTCLVHSFSYGSGISSEAKQGNPMDALGESISFGRFMTESLSWEKWSTFPHKRYVEEAERYAQPGSVAQKKAFFEAHYKSIAAKKAAALLEQANNNASSKTPEQETEAEDSVIATEVLVDEKLEAEAPTAEPDSVVKVKEDDSVAKEEVEEENYPKSDESLNQLENAITGNLVSEMEISESSQMEKPLLEGYKSSEEAAPSPTPIISKNISAFSSSRTPAAQSRAPKVPASPAKLRAPAHAKRENNATPLTRKSAIDYNENKRSNSKSLHEVIYSTPARRADTAATTPAAAWRIDSSRVAPSPYKATKDYKTPLRTPIMASANGVLKHPPTTPCSENRRSRTALDTSALGSKTSGPKWHILSAVGKSCSKSLLACKNKLQSPTLSVPFSLRTEERAARRKQKLEEKFNAKETQKVQLQTRLKEKAGKELGKLRQSFCFKARPLPEFYKERETSNDLIKNVKIPLTNPQSPKLGRKPSSNALQGITSLPPKTASTKSTCHKKISEKKSHPLTSRPEMSTHENRSPNILH